MSPNKGSPRRPGSATVGGNGKRARSAPSGSDGRAAPRDTAYRAGLAALAGTYAAGVGTAAWVAGRRGLPDRIGAADLALIGIATHKLSRRLTKDRVTEPFREPFAERKSTQGPGEVEEEVTVTGAKRAVGELITCPFCIGQWVATGFTFGLVFAPRATRLAASIFGAAAIADFLQFAYASAEQSS